jgi:2-oxoglutarate/2-oxoacid ferredoxin oxidoreductase subunit alpha
MRFSIKFGGKSGQGINTLGHFIAKGVKNSGYYTFAYREYPSIIKGGSASFQIDFSDKEILSSTKKCEILATIDDEALHQYISTVSENGLIIYTNKDFKFSAFELEYIKEKKIELIYLDILDIAKKSNAPEIMANISMLGFLWKVLGLDTKVLERIIRRHFAKKKNIDIEAEIRCLLGGYKSEEIKGVGKKIIPKRKLSGWKKSKLLTCNDAIALGAISAGCRAYYAYPMTPSTSILELLGNTSNETGLLIKQAESEITAIQMVMGSMLMGTRAFTATSGGGFDLMTETISCAGMTETPLVIVLGQRTGSGTGVPTWTGTSDVYAAVNSGHGEFPRCVLSCSDVRDSYELIQEAFNIAEQYQIPVILLTEKQTAESLFNVNDLTKPIRIKRGFKLGSTRYQLTENGISPRWIPQKGRKTYLINSDEHNPKGESTEDPNIVIAMSEKRMEKVKTLRKNTPLPKYYGKTDAELIFVGMGSTKNSVLDVMKRKDVNVGYLHYKYIYPLRYEKVIKLLDSGKKIVLIENNQTGLLGKLFKQEGGIEFTDRLLKYDSRPFFYEDILDYLFK